MVGVANYPLCKVIHYCAGSNETNVSVRYIIDYRATYVSSSIIYGYME